MAVVKLENVSKSWGDFKAVDDFNLTTASLNLFYLKKIFNFFKNFV